MAQPITQPSEQSGEVTPGTPFSQVDQPHPEDMATLAKNQASPVTRVAGMLGANAGLVDHPAVAKSLLSQPNGNGEQLGLVAHVAGMAGSVHEAAKEAANATHPHASSWWSGVLHSVASNWDNLRHQTASVYDAVGGMPGGSGGSFEKESSSQRAAGLVAGGKATWDAAAGLASEGTSKGVSLGSGGAVNLQNGVWSFTANPDVMRHHLAATLDSLKNDVATGLNPYNHQSIFWLMPHMGAFALSMAKRRGWAYTMEYLAPFIASGVLTGGVATGAGGAVEDAGIMAGDAGGAAVETTAQAAERAMNAAKEAPMPAKPGDLFTHPNAPAPTEFPDEMSPESVRSRFFRHEKPTTRSKIFGRASRTSTVVTKPLSGVAHVLHAAAVPGSDLRLNAMYLTADAAISKDPQFSALWKLTSNGIPVDQNGKPMGNLGFDIARMLGAPAGALNTLIADPINAYANFLGSDPLGAGLKVIGATRTFDSTAGIVGHFFRGMGIRTPDDVYRAAEDYRRVRRAFSWMGAHSAAAIEDTFRGMFKGVEGRKVLNLIGDAKNGAEVQKIFADMASGDNFIKTMAPSMSLYQLTKATFKLGGADIRVGDVLAGSPSEVEAAAKDIKKATGESAFPLDSANSAVAHGHTAGMLRARNLAGKFFTRILHQQPMYLNEETSKMDGFLISRRSVGVAHAVGDQLTALRYPRAARLIAQDAILHATPTELNNVVMNFYKDALTRLTYASMKTSALDTVKLAIEKDIFTELSNRMGHVEAGGDGVMVNGPEGYLRSLADKGSNAAIDSTQLAQLHFPRTRDLVNYAKRIAHMADTMTIASDAAPGVDLHLSPESLDRRAAFANANLTGMAKRLEDVAKGIESPTPVNLGDAQGAAYEAKVNDIARLAREEVAKVAPGDAIGHNRAFVNVFLKVRQNLDVVQRTVDLVENWNSYAKMFRSTNPFEVQLRLEEMNAQLPEGTFTSVADATPAAMDRLHGELAALQRAAAEMTARLQKESITLEDIQANLKQRDPNLSDEAAQRLANQIQHVRERNPRYRNGFQFFVDGVNRYQSDVFVPLALFSGGWGMRVGTSEFLLNAFREGGARMIETKLLTSYAKHELGKGFFSAELQGWVDRMMQKPIFSGSYIDMQRTRFLTYPQKVLSSSMRVALKSILAMKDLAGGTLHGLEGNLVVWTPRTERLFDRVVGAIQDHAPGGLPMGVHSTGSVVTSEAMRQGLLYGDDGEMSTVAGNRSFVGTNADNVNYHKSLYHALTQLHEGEQMRPGVDALYEATRGMDLSKPIDQATVDKLLATMTEASLKKIDSMSVTELNAFVRHSTKGDTALPDEVVFNSLTPAQKLRVTAMSPEKQSIFYAHQDWARTLAYHDLNTVMGHVGNGQFMIHSALLDMAHSGNVLPMPELKTLIDKLANRTEPLQIITETHKEEDAKGLVNRMGGQLRQLGHTDIIRQLTDVGFRRFLGPMVNALVRDPIYLGIFDREMERMQPLVDNNLIDELTQKINAHSNSVVEMSKYVHNPLDRTAFESSMRWLSPFYFAQNQAWRRVMRVASTDPGAAEKYLKAALLMTNYVSVLGTKGHSLVNIPASEWTSGLAGFAAHDGPFMSDAIGALGIGMGAWVSSLNSILPTGSEAGLGVLENIARPAAGPLVSTVVKVVQHVLGIYNVPYANKVANTILGPIGANVSLQDGLFPSAFFRNAYIGVEGGMNQNYSAYTSTQMSVLKNAIQNKYMEFYDQTAKVLKINELSGAARTKVEALARSIADTQTTLFMDPGTPSPKLQEFMDQVHAASTTMFLVKTALSMGSPFALSLQDTFEQLPEFQKILNEKLPDGRPKYTFQEAANLYTEKDPAGIFSLVASTMPDGASYPETQAAVNLIQNHPYVVKQYPEAAAYLAQRNGAYSPAARQLELTGTLRSNYNIADTQPGGKYFNALLIAMGNDYYYNYLQPEYTGPNGSQTYQQYTELNKIALSYGKNVNPTWYGYMKTGGEKWKFETAAVTQMLQMFKDPNVPASAYGGENDMNMYKLLMVRYEETAKAYEAASSSTARYAIESAYYTQMTTLANSGALSSALSYFVTNVLRNLPTAKAGIP